MIGIGILLTLFLLIFPESAQAGFLDQEQLVCIKTGSCGLDDITLAIVSLIQLLLGTMGAAALLYFVWGAVQWIISGGNAERVQKGKNIMVHTIYALLIAFGSFIILEFFVNEFLGVEDSRYRIENQCSDQARGTPCNQEVGQNYVCDGNDNCVTRCQLKNIDQPEEYTYWQCYQWTPERLQDAGETGIIIERGLCPGDEYNICTSFSR